MGGFSFIVTELELIVRPMKSEYKCFFLADLALLKKRACIASAAFLIT